MLFVAELAVAIALLVAGGIAFRRAVRERFQHRGPFWMRVAVGVLAGGYLSIGLVWQSATTRFFGAPLTAAVFQRSPNGYWQDFVGPLTLPAMLINFAVGFFIPHLAAQAGAFLRSGR
jgi:hypothetical protein